MTALSVSTGLAVHQDDAIATTTRGAAARKARLDHRAPRASRQPEGTRPAARKAEESRADVSATILFGRAKAATAQGKTANGLATTPIHAIQKPEATKISESRPLRPGRGLSFTPGFPDFVETRRRATRRRRRIPGDRVGTTADEDRSTAGEIWGRPPEGARSSRGDDRPGRRARPSRFATIAEAWPPPSGPSSPSPA